jgi:hypothetical protein
VRWRRSPIRVPIATAAIVGYRLCAAPERILAVVAKNPDTDRSLTLMMRVQQDPADPAGWKEFVRRYPPMIRAWWLVWGSQPSDADDPAQQALIRLTSAMRER